MNGIIIILFNIMVMFKRVRGCGRPCCREFALWSFSVLSRIRIGGSPLQLIPVLSDRFREKAVNFLGNG